MRSLLLALGMCLCASAAQAQVEQGSFKLSIDTDIINYISSADDDDGAEYTRSYLSFGPGGSAIQGQLPGYVALAFGYVANPHVIPQLHLGFARVSGETEVEFEGESDSNDTPTQTTLMLRPELEIPFNPQARAVGYGLIGFDYRHIGESYEEEDSDFESSINGFGPVLGVGLHLFVVSKASLDLCAQYSYLTFKGSAEVDGEELDGGKDVSASVFSITAGLSLWP